MDVAPESPSQALPIQVPLVRHDNEVMLGDSAYRRNVMQQLARLPEGATGNLNAPNGRSYELSMRGRETIRATTIRVRKEAEELFLVGATTAEGTAELEPFRTASTEDTAPEMHALRDTDLEKARTATMRELTPQEKIVETTLMARITSKASDEEEDALKIARSIVNHKRKRKNRPALKSDEGVSLSEFGSDLGFGDVQRFIEQGMALIPQESTQLSHHKISWRLCQELAEEKGTISVWAKALMQRYEYHPKVVDLYAAQAVSGKAAPTVAQILRDLSADQDPEAKEKRSGGYLVERGLKNLATLLETRGAVKAVSGDAAELERLGKVVALVDAALAPGAEGKRKTGGAAILSARSGQSGKKNEMEGLKEKLTKLHDDAKRIREQEKNG